MTKALKRRRQSCPKRASDTAHQGDDLAVAKGTIVNAADKHVRDGAQRHVEVDRPRIYRRVMTIAPHGQSGP
jgi:hypothetical protein